MCTKRWISAVLCVYICLWFQVPHVHADAPEDVRAAIEQDFQSYRGSLEVDKANYGLTPDEKATETRLGEGQPYYSLSPSFRETVNKSDQTLVSMSNELFEFQGYIFPIHSGNKPAGIVNAVQEDGIWKVSNISSNLTFEQALLQGKSSLTHGDSAKLIYDPIYGLIALFSQENQGDIILPIRDSIFLGLEDGKPVDVAEFVQKLQTLEKDTLVDGFGLGPILNNLVRESIPVGVVLLFAGIGLLIYMRKTKPQT